MADVHDKKTRRYNMSMIKGKNTKPERLVRKFLLANGFRYRLHVKTLPGKPKWLLPIVQSGNFYHVVSGFFTNNFVVAVIALEAGVSFTFVVGSEAS
jgi:DNA mismatch endonuclease Vsr